LVLYWISFVAIVPFTIYEIVSLAWSDFDGRFIDLQKQTFGYSEYSDLAIAVAGAIILAHIISAVALFWTLRWARFLFWFTIVIAMIFDFAWGNRVSYSSREFGWFDTWSSALFGAIILVSYCLDERVTEATESRKN
jgi:hypothetical protein